jgi:hypothetical protein
LTARQAGLGQGASVRTIGRRVFCASLRGGSGIFQPGRILRAGGTRPMTTQIRLALLGCGTVGGAVLQAMAQPDHPLASAELVGVAVRDVAAAVARGVPSALLTTDPIALAARPDVDVVIELMGGTDVAL